MRRNDVKMIQAIINMLLVLAVLVLAFARTDIVWILAVLLVLAAMVLWVIDFLIRFRRRPSASLRARAIAAYHLNQMKSVPGFSDLQIGASYPVLHAGGKTPAAFDVKLVSTEGADRGYMIVNLDKHEFPLPEFTTTGPCLTEQFRTKLGHRNFRLVWVNPTYAFAMDKNDKILAEIGTGPVPSKDDSERSSKITDKEYLQYVIEFQQDWRARHKKAIDRAWHRLPGGARRSRDLVQVTEPSGYYVVDYADGYERSPHFKQIDPHTGANGNKDYPSGCGPTAWATLIAWHDLMWTPELLRGSQNANGIPWGNPLEESWNTYMDRIMMDLGRNEYLDNHDCSWYSGNDGITHDGNMKHGFNYITNELGHSFTGRDTGDDDLQKVQRSIVLDRRPILIKTPNHFCVVAGFWYDNDGENHYLLLNTGWDSPINGWIAASYLEKYWYLKDILPRTQTSTPSLGGDFGPTLCTKKGPNGFYENPWVFWLDNGKICYANNVGGQLPDLGASATLNVDALYPPAVVADPNTARIYLLYVDPQHKMHLLNWLGPEKRWNPLVFPSDLTTQVRPAILGRQGDWFTVAFSNNDYGVQIISTCGDLEQASPNPWPNQIGDFQNDRYWSQVDPLGTSRSLSIISYQDYTVLLWVRSSNYINVGGKLSCRLAKPNGSLMGYIDTGKSYGMGGAPNLVLSNKTLFGTYRSDLDRIFVERFEPVPPHEVHFGNINMTVGASLSSTMVATLNETCKDEPSLGFIELEEGKHPQLVLGWKGTDSANSLMLRLLSVDCPGAFLNYIDKP